jgi:hypothetical protein
VADVIPVVKAWRNSPSAGSVSGGTSQGYNNHKREYNFTLSSSPLSFDLSGTSNNQVHNPCFVIKNWGGNESAEITINTVPQSSGPDFRQGMISVRVSFTIPMEHKLWLSGWIRLPAVRKPMSLQKVLRLTRHRHHLIR